MKHNRRKYNFNQFILHVVSLLLLMSSCIPQKRIEYLYDKENNSLTYENRIPETSRIKPGDELHIRVASFDAAAYNFFGNQAEGRALNYPNEIAVSLVSYSVDDSGYIHFPVLGRVFLNDLTLEEANDRLETLLSDYFQQPNVLVTFVLKKIAILGEVRNPGYFTYTNTRINIFQALGMAGDITVLGNKRKVMIIRQNSDVITKQYFNLTSDDIILSDFFYLEPTDVIFVPPSRARFWSISSTPYSLILTSITTLLLLLNYFS